MALYTLSSVELDPRAGGRAGWAAVRAAEEGAGEAVAGQLVAVEAALQPIDAVVDGGDGALSAFVRAQVVDRPGTDAWTVVPIDPPLDAPTRDLDEDQVEAWVAATVAELERRARPLVVTTSEHLTGRPLGGPAAVVAGAATAWARGSGWPVLHVGPWGEGPARFGVTPIDGATLRAGLRTAAVHGRVWAVDAVWSEVVAAFPHLRPLVAELLVERTIDLVRAEVARLAKRADPPVDRALRDLGLDSLTLEELRARLEARLGRALPQRLTFDHPTITAIARALDVTR